MKYPITIKDKKVRCNHARVIRPCVCALLFPLMHCITLTGQRGAVPLRPDLWGSVLRSPVADIWMQPGASYRALQRRLSGPEARETLSGQRKHLSRKSAVEPHSNCSCCVSHIDHLSARCFSSPTSTACDLSSLKAVLKLLAVPSGRKR